MLEQAVAREGKKGGQRSQEKTKKTPDFKQMIANAFAPIRDDLAKLPSKETVNAMLDNLLARIEERIEAKVQERVGEFISSVDALEQNIESLESSMVVLEHLHKKRNENEQYSRRACLRIVNVPLSKERRKREWQKESQRDHE